MKGKIVTRKTPGFDKDFSESLLNEIVVSIEDTSDKYGRTYPVSLRTAMIDIPDRFRGDILRIKRDVDNYLRCSKHDSIKDCAFEYRYAFRSTAPLKIRGVYVNHSLVKSSHLIPLYIPVVKDTEQERRRMKKELSQIPNLAYIGDAICGSGLIALLYVRRDDCNPEYARAIMFDFAFILKERGVFFSEKTLHFNEPLPPMIDDEAIWNLCPTPFDCSESTLALLRRDDDGYVTRLDHLFQLTDYLSANHIDIFASYGEWKECGEALMDTYGGPGGTIFIRLTCACRPEFLPFCNDIQRTSKKKKDGGQIVFDCALRHGIAFVNGCLTTFDYEKQ